MASHTPSRGAVTLTWLVLALAVLLLVWGAIKYGFSLDIQHRLDRHFRALRWADDVPLLFAADHGGDCGAS